MLRKLAEGLLLIMFQDQARDPAGRSVARYPKTRSIRQLEYELRDTKEDLQSTIEELESSNEELKASNEEVMSMNEELQSANEELETSKEELQSLNEELTTVNNQLQDKVEELETANNDMANLLNCTDIATVFLDTAFVHPPLHAADGRLFNLIAARHRPAASATSRPEVHRRRPAARCRAGAARPDAAGEGSADRRGPLVVPAHRPLSHGWTTASKASPSPSTT